MSIASLHRFLSNDRNAAAAATVAAGSILPAEATAFPLARTRVGSARAALSGGYTGAEDGTLAVEILTATGDGLLSDPVFAGAGNGTLGDLAATAVPAQTFTLLLASTGTATEPARAEFFGVILQAKAVGAAGNGLTLSTNRAGLTATATVYSFLEDVAAGTSELRGAQWDFGAYALTADGEMDSRTARLRFGHDPQIYRQYKTWSDGDWVYLLDPPLVRALPAETLVYTIAGTYTVTVTLGATVETYAALTTLFDGLNALRTLSNLVEVVGVVVQDRTPGGMAAEDWPLRTDAYALPATYTGNARFPGMGAVAVPSAAPTEIVTLTCRDVSTLGGEIWGVRGTVTGALPDSVTGNAYTSGGYGWTVPRVLPDATDPDPSGRIYVKEITFAARPPGDGAQGLELCISPLIAGAQARAKTIEVIYTEKPPVDCLCEDAQVSGRLNPRCLGVEIDEDPEMAIVAAYQTRLESLYGWRSAFVATNTAVSAAGELRAAQHDILLCNLATTEFAQCLADLFGNSPTPITAALTAWDAALIALDAALTPLEGIGTEAADALLTSTASTAYVAGDVRRFTYGAWVRTSALTNDLSWRFVGHRYYQCVVAGTTGAFNTANTWDPLQIPFGTSDWQEITLQEAMVILGADAIDINSITPVMSDPGIARDPQTFVARYQSKMDEVRALAGLVPKSDASTDGTECWRPCEGNFEWRVNGFEYAPACTNSPYHSAIRTVDADGRESSVVATQEFGFVIRCACPERLLPGDRFVIVIDNDAQPARTYAAGDTIKIPVIAARALDLAGGVNGDNTLTWTVRGSLNATWANYTAAIGSEPLYDQGGLQFRIRAGGIPFELGDRFTFTVAGGTFRWRWDADAWSNSTALAVAPTSLSRGVSLEWLPGPAPAFVAADEYAWTVKQPHAPALARQPDRRAWRWSGAGATWTATFAADTPITAVALWHDCPAGATFALEGLSAADAVLWARPLPYRPKLALAVLEGADDEADDYVVANCRKLRLTVAGATAGAVRWVWCGAPWTPAHPASSITLSESWQLRRGALSARYQTRGAAGSIAWQISDQSWIESTDKANLLALIEHLKQNDDQPFIFVPNRDFPAEARLVRIGDDEISFADLFQFQYTPRRVMDVRLPLVALPL